MLELQPAVEALRARLDEVHGQLRAVEERIAVGDRREGEVHALTVDLGQPSYVERDGRHLARAVLAGNGRD